MSGARTGFGTAVSGCCYRLCLLVGTPVLQSNRSAALEFRLLDEAIPIMDITLALSQKVVSKSEILGVQRIYSLEHVAGRGDEHLYQIPAIKVGCWEKYSRKTMKNILEAMELYWLAAIAMGVRVWNFVGASQREWTAEGQGRQLPVTGIG